MGGGSLAILRIMPAATSRPGDQVVKATVTAISLFLVLVVLVSVAVVIWVFVYGSVYKGLPTIALSHAALGIALVCLAATPRSTQLMGVILGITAIPGALALCGMCFYAVIIWTGGVHTFASGWGPIGKTFFMVSPVFAPSLAAVVAIWLRACPARMRATAVFGLSAVIFGLSLPGLMAM